jgi:dihydrofolate reductase
MWSAGTYLYGRRMYETLAVWETDPTLAARSDLMANYANAWQAADKVVYSSTLTASSTANTRLECHFDPSAVHELKADAATDLLVGGQNLAAQALVAGLVDQFAASPANACWYTVIVNAQEASANWCSRCSLGPASSPSESWTSTPSNS